MAESYSVKAVLSAVDRNFSSTFKNCLGTLNNVNNKISGMAFGFLSGAGMAAFNAVTGSVGGLISEIDSSNASWKTFEKNMQIVEKSGGKLEMSISDVKGELQKFAQQTVYSSSDMASTYAQLAAVGTKNTLELVKGFGGLASAAENPQQAMKTLSQQATQMAAKPKVAWADFKLMLEQTPAGIAAVAKHMGMSTAEMVTAVQDGKIKTEDFFNAISTVGGAAGSEFQKMATEAKTVGQAVDGLKETVSNKLTPAFDIFSKLGIKAVNSLADKLAGINVDKITFRIRTGISSVISYINKAKKYVDVFKTSFSGVGSAFKGAFSSMKSAVSDLFVEFGSTESLNIFKNAADGVAGTLKKLFGFIQANAGTIKEALSTGFSIAKGIWESFSGAAKKVGGAVMDLIGYIVANSDVFMSILGAGVAAVKPYWDAFVNVLTFAIGIVKKIATVIVEHADTIKALIPWVLAAVAAFKGFKIVQTFLPFLSGFATKLGSMAKTLAGGLANKLLGVSKAQDSVGKSSATSGKDMIQSATAMLIMAAAVAVIAAGFALLTQSAIALAGSGGAAIAVMAGMVVAIAGLGAGMAVILKVLAPMGAQLMPVATAMLAMGAAVVLVSTGFALLAQSSIALANAGTPAILVMVGMVAAIALLAVGAAALAPALTAGAVGLIAFGAAITLCGVGAVLAATSLVILSTCLPELVANGTQGAVAILALGSAMLVFGAGATVAGAGAVVLAAGLVAVAAGIVAASAALVVLTAGILALTVGVLALSVGVTALGASLLIVATSFTLIGGVLPGVVASSVALTASFTAMLAVGLLLAAALTAVNVPLVLIGASSLVASAGMLAFGVSMTTGAVGTLAMAAALLAVTAEMTVIASKAKSAEKSLQSMNKSVNLVEQGLQALESKAKDAMNKLKKAFDDTAKDAEKSGKAVGENFSKGMEGEFRKAPNIATKAVMTVNNTLKSGQSGAYSAGAYISQGFAQGMQSCLGQIQAAAAAMVAAAEAAIRAKAMIHSPSRLTEKLGNYFGEGFEVGIVDMFGAVKKASEKLVAIPQVQTPQLAFAGGYGYELSDDFEYTRNSQYTIEVPLSVDGREFAKATASYTEEELNRKQSRDYRKQGRL